jgi:hypothetical protein
MKISDVEGAEKVLLFYTETAVKLECNVNSGSCETCVLVDWVLRSMERGIAAGVFVVPSPVSLRQRASGKKTEDSQR